MAAAKVNGVGGARREREREPEEGRGTGEGERGQGCVASPGASRRSQAGWEGGGGGLGRAGVDTPLPTGRGGRRPRRPWWAGLILLGHQVSGPQVSVR